MNSGNTFHCDKVHAFFIARTQCLNSALSHYTISPGDTPLKHSLFLYDTHFFYKSFKEHSSLTEYAKACHLPLNSSLIRDN